MKPVQFKYTVFPLAVKTNLFSKLPFSSLVMGHLSYKSKVPVAIDVPFHSNVLANLCKYLLNAHQPSGMAEYLLLQPGFIKLIQIYIITSCHIEHIHSHPQHISEDCCKYFTAPFLIFRREETWTWGHNKQTLCLDPSHKCTLKSSSVH